MSMQRIEIIQDFNYPAEKLFSYLSEHENLTTLFKPAKIKRLSNGADTRNGVGSAREMTLPLVAPFVETVTGFRNNEQIEYRITQGSPLKNHCGVMRFSNTPQGSRLHYTIEFQGRYPLIGPVVKVLLENGIRLGLKRIR
jgi:uncharacterized membrane protein